MIDDATRSAIHAAIQDSTKSNAEIARRFGVAKATIRSERAKLGLPSESEKLTAAVAAKRTRIQELHSLGLTNAQIAREAGVKNTYVSENLKSMGLTRNPHDFHASGKLGGRLTQKRYRPQEPTPEPAPKRRGPTVTMSQASATGDRDANQRAWRIRLIQQTYDRVVARQTA